MSATGDQTASDDAVTDAIESASLSAVGAMTGLSAQQGSPLQTLQQLVSEADEGREAIARQESARVAAGDLSPLERSLDRMSRFAG